MQPSAGEVTRLLVELRRWAKLNCALLVPEFHPHHPALPDHAKEVAACAAGGAKRRGWRPKAADQEIGLRALYLGYESCAITLSAALTRGAA